MSFKGALKLPMDSDDETDEQAATLTSFLFGNIDKEGRLEDDVLDEVRKWLASLHHRLQSYQYCTNVFQAKSATG